MVKNNIHRNGQIMIEIIIALGVFSLLASALTTLVFSSSAGFWVGDTEAQAAALLRQSIEEIKQTKASAWNGIFVGTTTVAVPQSDIANMTKTIAVSDVCRSAGVIVACSGGAVDVFSKRVTVSIAFETRTGRTREMSSDVILTNWDSVDWNQTSWAGGSGADVFTGATQYAYDDSGVTVQGDGSVRLASAPATCQGYTWDFNTPNDYTFDTQATQVQSGDVSVVADAGMREVKTWDFNTPSEYTYSAGYTQFQNGIAVVTAPSGFAQTKVWDFNTPSEYSVSSGSQVYGGVGMVKVTGDDASTVALYHMDEASGNFLDSSGRNNHLTTVGSPSYGQVGKFTSSVLFDSTGTDYASIKDTAQSGLDGLSQMTIDAWVKRSVVQSADAVIVKKWATATGRSYALQVTRLGAVRFYVSNSGSTFTLLNTANAVVAVDAWTHIAAVYDGTWLRVFVNGVQQGAPVAFSGTIYNGGDILTLSSSGSSVWNGYLDEIRISNVARWTANFTPPTSFYGSVANDAQTIVPTSGISFPAVQQWTGFTAVASVGSTASLRFQLSDDNGSSWKYWSGTQWALSTSLSNANTSADINSFITTFPTTTGKLLFRAVLQRTATDIVTLDEVRISHIAPLLDSAVVALYHLDETSGNFLDSSGRNNHLAPVGSPTYNQAGTFNASALFDSTGADYARIADSAQSGLDGMSQLTVDTWVKRATIPNTDAAIMRKWTTATGRSYALQITKTGSVRFYVSSNGTDYVMASTPNNVVAVSVWTHIAAVYDGSYVRIFVNGVQQGSSLPFSGSIYNGGDLFSISYSGSSVWNGYIDELRVSNVARWVANFTPYNLPYGQATQNIQVITPLQGVSALSVDKWSRLLVTSTVEAPATLSFQLSDNDGSTWKYWDGSQWRATSLLTQANTVVDINAHIDTFPTSTKKLLFRALVDVTNGGRASIDETSIFYTPSPLDEYVVALYHFDEASGTFMDSSGRNNHLTSFGVPSYGQSGYFSSSTLFDSVGNDYARILGPAQSGLSGMSQLTIDTWIKRSSVTAVDAAVVRKWIAAGQRAYSLQITPLGAIRLYVSGDGTNFTLLNTPNEVVPMNTWAHVAVTYDGTWLRAFVNGQLVGTPVAFSGTIFNSSEQFQVGYSGANYLNAYMDELRVSNVARWTQSFTPYARPYGTTSAGNTIAQITPKSSFTNQAVSQWYSFSESAQKNSGAITYQLSADNGATWNYWNGTAWVSATLQTQANDAQTISSNMWAYPVGTKQIRFRAFLTKDAVLDSVSVDCSTLQMEAGDMSVSGSGTTALVFANRYARPVVFVSTHDGGSASPIVVSVSSTGATLSLQTKSGGSVSDTQTRYMVVEEGVWNVQGMLVEAKRMNASVVNGSGLSTTTFRHTFGSSPVVFAQRMSRADVGFVIGQATNVTQTSAQIGLSSVGGNMSHPQEQVGWIAVEPNRAVTIGRSQVRTGSITVGNTCANISLFSAVGESPSTLSVTQASTNGWSTSCGESTTTTIALQLGGGVETAVSTGYIAFTRPFRYTEALTQSSGYVGRGSLTSSAFPLGDHDAVQIFDMNSTLPTCSPACRTYGYVRVASDTVGVPSGWSTWYGPVTTTEPVLLPQTLNGAAWVQYRIDLFGDGLQTPVLRATSVNYK